ncbi:zinc resistance-associated protein [Escherichia coli]|nr:zinc resistance-associated protein [Escherichia marmotae]EFO1363277.1 zinc resistance-associated protein [Escherichia coli]EFO1476933.1 zinc resistance-associated protein [Escherichia coli]
MTRYPPQAGHFYSLTAPDCPLHRCFIVGTKDAIRKVRQPLED